MQTFNLLTAYIEQITAVATLPLMLLPALAMTAPTIKQRTPTRRTIIIGMFMLLCACLFWITIYPQTHWATKARWRVLDRMTEVTGGQVEVIVPASTYIRAASISPDGRWLFWGSAQTPPQRYFLNLETGEQYDVSYLETGKSRWITNEDIALRGEHYLILHIPDLSTRELEVILPSEANEVLKDANNVYVVKGFNNTGTGTGLLSLDPAFPYAVREHIERDEVTIDYTYMPDMLEGYEDGFVSPDGTLIAINKPGEKHQMLEIQTIGGETVATAQAKGRTPFILGWGADGRSVYFLEQARGLSSDTERPIFKLTIDDPTGEE